MSSHLSVLLLVNPALSSITIPTSVVTIGTAAFEQSGLTSIIIPTSVTYIGAVCTFS